MIAATHRALEDDLVRTGHRDLPATEDACESDAEYHAEAQKYPLHFHPYLQASSQGSACDPS
jgi:hypothetical protein